MQKQITLLVCFFLFLTSGFGQADTNAIKDTSFHAVKYINPNPDLDQNEFVECYPARVLLYSDSAVDEIAYMRRNFTDQFLQVCYNKKMLPASKIFGFSMNGKYYRSGHTHDVCHVFAEKILSGKYSLYYCRNIPYTYGEIELISTDPQNPDYTNRMIVEDRMSKRYKNDFAYFVSSRSDSLNMIYVNNDNIGSFAKDYLSGCPPAYRESMVFVRRYKTVQKITLPLAVTSYAVSLLNFGGTGVIIFNYKSPFLYLSLASLGTFIYYRVKAKNKYLHPNDMIRIISTYNSY